MKPCYLVLKLFHFSLVPQYSLLFTMTSTYDRGLYKVIRTDSRGDIGLFMRPFTHSPCLVSTVWHTESQAMTVISDKWKNSEIPVCIWGPQLITDWIGSRYDSYSLCFNFLSLACSGWLYLINITAYITPNHEEGYSVKFLTSWWHFPFPFDL